MKKEEKSWLLHFKAPNAGNHVSGSHSFLAVLNLLQASKQVGHKKFKAYAVTNILHNQFLWSVHKSKDGI